MQNLEVQQNQKNFQGGKGKQSYLDSLTKGRIVVRFMA